MQAARQRTTPQNHGLTQGLTALLDHPKPCTAFVTLWGIRLCVP